MIRKVVYRKTVWYQNHMYTSNRAKGSRWVYRGGVSETNIRVYVLRDLVWGGTIPRIPDGTGSPGATLRYIHMLKALCYEDHIVNYTRY